MDDDLESKILVLTQKALTALKLGDFEEANVLSEQLRSINYDFSKLDIPIKAIILASGVQSIEFATMKDYLFRTFNLSEIVLSSTSEACSLIREHKSAEASHVREEILAMKPSNDYLRYMFGSTMCADASTMDGMHKGLSLISSAIDQTKDPQLLKAVSRFTEFLHPSLSAAAWQKSMSLVTSQFPFWLKDYSDFPEKYGLCYSNDPLIGGLQKIYLKKLCIRLKNIDKIQLQKKIPLSHSSDDLSLTQKVCSVAIGLLNKPYATVLSKSVSDAIIKVNDNASKDLLTVLRELKAAYGAAGSEHWNAAINLTPESGELVYNLARELIDNPNSSVSTKASLRDRSLLGGVFDIASRQLGSDDQKSRFLRDAGYYMLKNQNLTIDERVSGARVLFTIGKCKDDLSDLYEICLKQIPNGVSIDSSRFAYDCFQGLQKIEDDSTKLIANGKALLMALIGYSKHDLANWTIEGSSGTVRDELSSYATQLLAEPKSLDDILLSDSIATLRFDTDNTSSLSVVFSKLVLSQIEKTKASVASYLRSDEPLIEKALKQKRYKTVFSYFDKSLKSFGEDITKKIFNEILDVYLHEGAEGIQRLGFSISPIHPDSSMKMWHRYQMQVDLLEALEALPSKRSHFTNPHLTDIWSELADHFNVFAGDIDFYEKYLSCLRKELVWSLQTFGGTFGTSLFEFLSIFQKDGKVPKVEDEINKFNGYFEYSYMTALSATICKLHDQGAKVTPLLKSIFYQNLDNAIEFGHCFFHLTGDGFSDAERYDISDKIISNFEGDPVGHLNNLYVNCSPEVVFAAAIPYLTEQRAKNTLLSIIEHGQYDVAKGIVNRLSDMGLANIAASEMLEYGAIEEALTIIEKFGIKGLDKKAQDLFLAAILQSDGTKGYKIKIPGTDSIALSFDKIPFAVASRNPEVAELPILVGDEKANMVLKVYLNPESAKAEYDALKNLESCDGINAPKAYELFETEAGSAVLMEKLEGTSLEEVLSESSMERKKQLCNKMLNVMRKYHQVDISIIDDLSELSLREYFTNRIRNILGPHLSSCSSVEEILNNYDVVLDKFASMPSVAYKDANPNNWLLTEDDKIIMLDFERDIRLPKYLDYVSILEFCGEELPDEILGGLIVDDDSSLRDYFFCAIQRHIEQAGYCAGYGDYSHAISHQDKAIQRIDSLINSNMVAEADEVQLCKLKKVLKDITIVYKP